MLSSGINKVKFRFFMVTITSISAVEQARIPTQLAGNRPGEEAEHSLSVFLMASEVE
jgi:hypothetical protein